MSRAGSSDPVTLPPTLLQGVDRACNLFEAAWQDGGRPRIEDHLGGVPEPARPALLGELLALELDYRRRAGEVPTPEDYQARFPGQAELIATAFEPPSARERRAAGSGADAPGEATCLAGSEDSTASGGDPPAPDRAPGGRPGDPPEGPAAGPAPAGYELLERVGQGGMGIVYRARQRPADRIVALKLIRPGWDDTPEDDRGREALARFRAEARAAARLEHDHIVPVYDVGQVGDRPYYAMRFIAGPSLAEVLRAGPLPGKRAAELLVPVARAVAHAHAQGILHRDLKPSNILLDADGRPYVADFGLAKLTAGAPGLTRSEAVLGSPPYMSPEQARDPARVGPAADIYSLGATLYEMVTGRPPFRAADAIQTLRQVIDEEPLPLRRLNPAVDRDLETICLKCLEKEPTRRYATAAALADDLRRYLQGEPTHARPIGNAERFWRRCRGNPKKVALSTMVGLLLAALAWLSVRELGRGPPAGPVVRERIPQIREAPRTAASRSSIRGDAMRRIRASGRLVYGCDLGEGGTDVHPVSSRMAAGCLAELMTSIGRDLGVTSEIIESPQRALFQLLDSRSIDLAANGVELTQDSERKYVMSRPYYINQLQLMVRRGSTIRSWAHLSQPRPDGSPWTVGVPVGSPADDFATRARPNVRVIPFEGATDAMMAVQNGQYDATLQDLPTARFYATQFSGLEQVGPLESRYSVVYVRWQDVALRDAIDQSLGRLIDSGELKQLYERCGIWTEEQSKLAEFSRHR